MLLQPVVGRLDAGVPLLPGRAAKLFWRGAVASKLAARDSMSGAGEAMGDKPELRWRSAEAMHQENAEAPAADELAAIRRLRVRRFHFLSRQVPMHAGQSDNLPE